MVFCISKGIADSEGRIGIRKLSSVGNIQQGKGETPSKGKGKHRHKRA